MKGSILQRLLILALCALNVMAKSNKKVLLSSIESLTLRKDLKTSHRRVSAIPQLRCIGGDAKTLYQVDVMRCKNSGAGYSEADVQWTCTASLPPEFKLGSTDVICEGYDAPDDPYILAGSCGVEYRLVLTEKGEKAYGAYYTTYEKSGQFERYFFWFIFAFVAIFTLLKGCIVRGGNILEPSTWGRPPPPPGRRPGGGGGGYRGGRRGGWDDPPPPYTPSPQPPRKSQSQGQGQQEAWRPGFWSGALGGAAAGYMAGNRSSRQTQASSSSRRHYDNGEGSSSSNYSSSRYESTGFGSTSRR